MSLAQAADIAFVRFRAPAFDRMEAFLSDFGLTCAHRDEGALYMKGIGGAPYAHVTTLGEPGFAGIAFALASETELGALAQGTGAPVEALDGPGGGRRVVLTDPDGFQVEAVVREHAAPALPARTPANEAGAKPRLNAPNREAGGPARIVRLGHAVLNVRDFRTSEAWYKHHFGLLTSDEIELAPGAALGAFLRCDQGARPVDHHTLFLVGTGQPKFNHAAFEVLDTDDLLSGHHHLKSRGYTHEWGVGRHILGSQIFDYWRDPWGHAVEHWTDGDLFDAESGSRIAGLDALIGTLWGPHAPPTMG